MLNIKYLNVNKQEQLCNFVIFNLYQTGLTINAGSKESGEFPIPASYCLLKTK